MRRIPLLWLLLPALAWAQEHEPISFPDTPHGEVVEAFFTAYAEGDDAVRAFMEAYRTEEALARRTMDQRMALFSQMRAGLGTLTPLRFEEDGDAVSVLAFSDGMQTWMQFDFTLVDGKVNTIGIQPTGPPRDEPYFAEWTDLDDLVTQAVQSSEVPALAVAWIRDGEIVGTAAAGVRQLGGDPVQVDDRFHVGSIAKSLTATVVARLVQDGTLSWDTTVAEALPAVPTHEAYQSVTLRQLADHIGGLKPWTNLTDADEERFGSLPGVGGQQRAGFLKYVLLEQPAAPPGEQMLYSNAGYSLLGHVAERKARTSWEKLLRRFVFDPLEMTTASVGWPTAPDGAGTRGHFGVPGSYRPRADGEYELGDYLDPAGDVSMSVGDLARYAREHLHGLRGEDGILSAESFATLHTSSLAEGGYAGGWVIDEAPDGRERHWHNGSLGIFFALMQIVPDSNWGVVAVMNAGSPSDVLDEIVDAVYARSVQ